MRSASVRKILYRNGVRGESYFSAPGILLIGYSVFGIPRRRVLRSHFVPDGPQIGKNRLEERLF